MCVCVLTKQFEDKVQLLLHCGAGEERTACRHLIEDTSHPPGGQQENHKTGGDRRMETDGNVSFTVQRQSVEFIRMCVCVLTTCRCVWSSQCCPAGYQGGGTTESPPRWSTSWWEWTWPEPDLEQMARFRNRPGPELTN